MRVVPVPCLSDNYAYLLVPDDDPRRAIVVDPSEAAPVIAAAEREAVELVAILATHHHWDHVGGNAALRERFPAIPVYAHVSDSGRVPEQTENVEEGRDFTVAGIRFSALHVPGHTTGAVAYVAEGAVFTGDTMFVAGCGRLFEGTPAMMYTSLVEKLAKLPPDTRVYCGHEYTVANLTFARHAEPGNASVVAKLERAKALRERGEPTVPSTIAEERETNPFLRVGEPELAGRYGGGGPADVLAAVRRDKDGFKA